MMIFEQFLASKVRQQRKNDTATTQVNCLVNINQTDLKRTRLSSVGSYHKSSRVIMLSLSPTGCGSVVGVFLYYISH